MSQHIILIFDIDKLPQLNSDERDWADSVLECLRGDNPRALPDGVGYVSDVKRQGILSALGVASPSDINRRQLPT